MEIDGHSQSKYVGLQRGSKQRRRAERKREKEEKREKREEEGKCEEKRDGIVPYGILHISPPHPTPQSKPITTAQ